MLLTEAITLTRRVRESWRPGAKGYKTTVYNTAWLVELLNNPHIETIKPMTIVELQTKLTEMGKEPGTVNRITQALRTVLNTCKKMEVLDKVPYFAELKEPPGRQVIYTEGEELSMYNACLKLNNHKDMMADILRFAFFTGCRQGELLKLTWSDVDFDRNRLTFFSTKSGQNRVLPMGGRLLELMKRLYEERIDECVFPIKKDTLIYYFRKVKKMAGIDDKDKVFHTIRHTVCSRLWGKGVPQPDIMAVLGHTQATTTQRYSHATEEGIGNALALL